MNNALIASSARLLPVRESTSTDSSKPAPLIERELSLSELASTINHEHQLCQEAYKESLLHAHKTGRLLLQAKAKVKESTSGRWLLWLKENCPKMPERTAQAYMQVAREWERIEESAMIADFGLYDALKFISEIRKRPKAATRQVELTDVVDAEWAQVASQKPQLNDSTPVLKERDRVIVTDAHPLFAGQHGTITGRPSVDAAIVALDEGARERISIQKLQPEELKPQDIVSEPKSRDEQLLPSIQSNPDVSPNEPSSTSASLVNMTAITNGKPDIVAVEIAIGIRHLTPEQLTWVISAAANNGLSDAHLKAAVKAAKQALNQRNHPEYFKIFPGRV